MFETKETENDETVIVFIWQCCVCVCVFKISLK